MTIVAYRPELENPTREGSRTFAIMDEQKKSMTQVRLDPGVNRKVKSGAWDLLKSTSVVQNLIQIGAIEELLQKANADEITVEASPDIKEVMLLKILDASKVIESSFDEKFLKEWKMADGRTQVINKINARLEKLRVGEG